MDINKYNHINNLYSFTKRVRMGPESDEEQQERKNPVRKAEKDKEFRTVGPLKQIFTNPQQLYEAAEKYNKTFKTVRNEHPVRKQYTIIDFSLNARGPDEDEIYVKQPFYRNNIRRGNTFLFNNKNKTAQIARKGLMKFFDISEKSLRAIRDSDLMSLSKKDQYNHYSVFKEVQNVLSCNEELEQVEKAKVHVYRLNKANGQNAQVSYNKTLNQWVISSKNVAIFVGNANDIKLYKGERYGFSILIAQTWFNIIQGLNKQELQNLKQQLAGKTMIGEYCGNPDFQHLVKYADITIYFYAIVEANSPYTCIPPNRAFNFFEKHKIPIVKNYEKSYLGEFTEFPALGQKLLQVFKEVSKASIFDEQQGSVVYFVIEKPKKFCEYISDRYLQETVPIPLNWEEKEVWEHVSSLGKLKTLEYRILRKLREKLKYFTRLKPKDENATSKQQDFKKFQEKYASFEKECYQLLKGETLSKPIEYYFCAGLLAMEYAYKHHKSSRAVATLNDHYLDFVSVIFWCIENKQPVTENLMKDDDLHKKLRGETWQKYSIEIVAEYPNMLERIVPKYAKIKKSTNVMEMALKEENGEKAEEKAEEKEGEHVESDNE